MSSRPGHLETVFLHTSPHAPVPELQETEVASAHWIPLELLHAPTAKYGSVEIDIASRLAPKNKVARAALKLLVGQMSFKFASPSLSLVLALAPIYTNQY